MEIKDIEKLAALSRINLSESEKQSLLADMGAILAYVDQIKEAIASTEKNAVTKPYLRNIFRADADPHQGGIFTETLLESAPLRHGQYIKVKKVL